MQTRNVHTLLVAVVVLVLAGAFSLALADQVVYFSNGKAMMVKKIEQGDVITILEIEGGGRIGVPTAQIVKIEEYAVSRPDNVRPPAAQQSRAVAHPPPASPGGTRPPVSASAAAPGATVNEPANLVADAPSVVPGAAGSVAEGLAAPREVVRGPGATGRDVEAVTGPPQLTGEKSAAVSAAAALAAQQSMAAKTRQRQRDAQLRNQHGRNRPRGGLSGQALMGGQSPRRPGQGSIQGGTNMPANARTEEKIVPAKPDRFPGKGASGQTPPPPVEDEKSKEAPSEAN